MDIPGRPTFSFGNRGGDNLGKRGGGGTGKGGGRGYCSMDVMDERKKFKKIYVFQGDVIIRWWDL